MENPAQQLMEQIHDQVKDNASELKYARRDLDSLNLKIDATIEKNSLCHTDLKGKIGDVNARILKLELEVAPVKRIVWAVLITMITGIVGGAVAILFR